MCVVRYTHHADATMGSTVKDTIFIFTRALEAPLKFTQFKFGLCCFDSSSKPKHNVSGYSFLLALVSNMHSRDTCEIEGARSSRIL